MTLETRWDEPEWYVASPHHKLFHLVVGTDGHNLVTACGRQLQPANRPRQAWGEASAYPRCRRCERSRRCGPGRRVGQ